MEYDVRRQDQQGRILHDWVSYAMLLNESQSFFEEKDIKQTAIDMIEVK